MKKLILAAAAMAGFAGNICASGGALDSLRSAVPPSLLGDIAVLAAVSPEDLSKKDSADVLAELKAAVKAAQIPAVEDNGRSFRLSSFPAQTSLQAMLAAAGNSNPGFYRMSSGDAAVRAFSKHLKEEAEIEASYGEPASAKAVLRVAAAAEKAFIGARQFAKVQLAANDIAENGEKDHQVIIAQETGGSFLVLVYINSPWSGKGKNESKSVEIKQYTSGLFFSLDMAKGSMRAKIAEFNSTGYAAVSAGVFLTHNPEGEVRFRYRLNYWMSE